MIYGILVLLSCIVLGTIIRHLIKGKTRIEDEHKDQVTIEKNLSEEKINRELEVARERFVEEEGTLEDQVIEPLDGAEAIEEEEGLEGMAVMQEEKTELPISKDIKAQTRSIKEEEKPEERSIEVAEDVPSPRCDLDDGFEEVKESKAMISRLYEMELEPNMDQKRERFIRITEEDIGEKICHFNYGEGIVHSIVKGHYVRIDFTGTGTILFPIGLSQNGGVMKLLRYRE